jgi:phosphatidylinositol alpha-1,6-mannosyltransferase
MLEANQNGCPVVAARLEGIQDVVTEGVNGHLVPSGDPRAFADTVLRYHDAPERLPAAARAAHVHSTAHFGWPSVADRYLAVLHRLVTAKTEGEAVEGA